MLDELRRGAAALLPTRQTSREKRFSMNIGGKVRSVEKMLCLVLDEGRKEELRKEKRETFWGKINFRRESSEIVGQETMLAGGLDGAEKGSQ